jgi:uncharacterized membrane protein YgcG
MLNVFAAQVEHTYYCARAAIRTATPTAALAAALAAILTVVLTAIPTAIPTATLAAASPRSPRAAQPMPPELCPMLRGGTGGGGGVGDGGGGIGDGGGTGGGGGIGRDAPAVRAGRVSAASRHPHELSQEGPSEPP